MLSLFDWISCGRVALERAGIEVESYCASEIDKYAIQVSEKNFPGIIHIWDVKNIVIQDNHLNIDLLIWGSPCQWFSRAWKQENFEDPRSKLFYEYVRILKETKPKYFILENVRMKPEFERKITQYLDWVEPILINSSLVSAQNRERLYWVWELQENGKYMTVDIPQPEDKKIFLKDILEDEVDEKYYLSEKAINTMLGYRQDYIVSWKSPTLTTELAHTTWKNTTPALIREIFYAQNNCIIQIPRWKNAWGFHSEKSPTLTSNQWEHNNPLFIPEATEKWYIEVQDWECFDFTHPTSSTRRGREMKEKSNCMTTSFDFLRYEKGRIRRLTPIECERLQTLPDNYTACVSNSQRYKQLGNWWTIDVIAHILSHLRFE